MRFCQFDTGPSTPSHVGVRIDPLHIMNVEALLGRPVCTMVALIQDIDDGVVDLPALKSDIERLSSGDKERLALPIDKIHLRAPVTEPPKFFAIAINGRANWERSIKPDPSNPQYFIKLRTCLTGPNDPLEIPDIGSVGPEVELALVIGRKGKHISAQDAHLHIFGYTVHNDLTAHDMRMKSEWIKLKRKDGTEEHLTYPGRWKNFDTFSPMGPFLVTTDEVPDPHKLELKAMLNGQLVQHGTSADTVYRIPELIEYLSAAHTLEVGDIISIGTVPAVEPWKMATIDLRRYGGAIEASIEGLGALNNPIHPV
jgi:2-keto-4-pentenoate hydratase/2-oxohepta-3-ene-1,7-dioic acid hydratase in catechol pathway